MNWGREAAAMMSSCRSSCRVQRSMKGSSDLRLAESMFVCPALALLIQVPQIYIILV
jgi:hypothetical protein